MSPNSLVPNVGEKGLTESNGNCQHEPTDVKWPTSPDLLPQASLV
jgi:hypothetical protein